MNPPTKEPTRPSTIVLGLVAGVERANGWTIAEFAGDRSPLGNVAAAESGGLGSGRALLVALMARSIGIDDAGS